MKQAHASYERSDANRLLPLLRSIGREIEERTVALEALERRIGRHPEFPRENPERGALVAEAATHRRELRRARSELQRFGCSVLGLAPLTIRIPGRDGEAKKSFVWQTGDPALR